MKKLVPVLCMFVSLSIQAGQDATSKKPLDTKQSLSLIGMGVLMTCAALEYSQAAYAIHKKIQRLHSIPTHQIQPHDLQFMNKQYNSLPEMKQSLRCQRNELISAVTLGMATGLMTIATGVSNLLTDNPTKQINQE